ncbi:hypothetical protein Ac2012v2_004401 [Leucoagaricus gongylophorus]
MYLSTFISFISLYFSHSSLSAHLLNALYVIPWLFAVMGNRHQWVDKHMGLSIQDSITQTLEADTRHFSFTTKFQIPYVVISSATIVV